MPEIGQRVGEYVLENPIGRGAFGEVWRARHHVWSEQRVAVKLPTDPSYLKQLRREGAFAPQLAHPNIVKALGFDPYADPPYLVMELVEGTSLRAVIERGPLAIGETIAVLRQVLTALAFAHEQGFVHRDIKPENVLIDAKLAASGYGTQGAVKLSDFGLGQSSRRMGNESIALSMTIEKEQAQQIVGTIEYMSPEQKSGSEIDHRTDLYAVGIILFELLTGKKPGHGEVPGDVMPEIPSHLNEVFRKACARKEKRYTSAGELLSALNASSALNAPPALPSTRTSAGSGLGTGAGAATISLERKARHDRCPHCQAGVNAGDQYCTSCGRQIVAHVKRCPACAGFPGPDDHYCIFCGTSLVAITGR
jgi:serine/threonine-protein kinase